MGGLVPWLFFPRESADRAVLSLSRINVSLGNFAITCMGGIEAEQAEAAHAYWSVPIKHSERTGNLFQRILQHPDGTVLKQLQPPPRGPREQEFYNKVYDSGCCDSILLELREYLPKYFGVWSPPAAPNDTYLKLEDVTRKFKKPCIMDVKIGQKSYDPYASAEKIQQQVSKYPLMEEIGFLVLGMRVYHVCTDSYETQNQHYGRSLTKETVKDGVSKFFHNGYCLRKDAVAASIQKIEKILEWFESQEQLNFYASSLLFVYEGSYQATTVRLGEVTLAEKRVLPRGLLGGDILEYNNNIHVINSTENGKIEASVSKGLSKFYALHKKAYSKRHHHGQLSLKVENLEQGNVWKRSTCITQEHLNGNVLPQLEKVFCHVPAEIKESANVEVRMIDFAHVFPSDTRDEGYIYGLKNLITVLQNILDN
ncbi:PREDICTED: inositol polyphosphate multikinase [Tinamus guttatus]|uniref:inositol polyphosphate multikinase n=1 Tax=Tinamus guttatus TaxID=94827 RepID=UPI00052F12C4|nr:PREDICTED: inositol polyphosphate multikinase [Tinamus guttatus]